MASARIPERFLRCVWQHRLFSSSALFTSDGARVAVRFPGRANTDGGPDFTGALIRIGGVLYRGDVELHIRAGSWRAHGHDADPHYNGVILHVVYLPPPPGPPLRTAAGRSVPLVVLSPRVDPLLYGRCRRAMRRGERAALPCRNVKGNIPTAVLTHIFSAAGRRRINLRVRSLGRRFSQIAAECGEESRPGSPPASRGDSPAWDQILYECLLEGMGYARNRIPFLALARRVPLSLLLAQAEGNALRIQAILFGAAGLLPSAVPAGDRACRVRAGILGRLWRSLRFRCGITPLHEGDWMFFRLRPVNFPTARLAAFCHLLPSFFDGHPLVRMLDMLGGPDASGDAHRRALAAMLRIAPDRFWRRHRHFRGEKSGGGIALGTARVHELIVNGIVPVLLLYARLNGDRAVRREALALLRSLPPAAENAVSRLMNAALAGGRDVPWSHVELQGMLHIYRLYCSRARCRLCPVTAPPGVRAAARGLRMSRRWSPARTSRCSHR